MRLVFYSLCLVVLRNWMHVVFDTLDTYRRIFLKIVVGMWISQRAGGGPSERFALGIE